MDSYYLFFDAKNKAIIVHNEPDAIDQAPYDRIVRRHSMFPVDAGYAELCARMYGAEIVYGDCTVTVTADYS